MSIKDIKAFQIYCIKEELIPFKVTFCVWKDCDQDTITNYGKKDGFSDYVKKLENMAEQELIQGATKGDLNPTMSIFLLKNHHGYRDRSEVTNEISITKDLDDFYEA